MSGRAATTDVIPGRLALSVGMPDRPAPPGWSWVNLDRVATMATGHTPSRNHPEYWGGDVPWISVRDARPFHGGVIHTTAEFTNPLGIENSAAVILPKNTVCLSRTGSIGYSILLGREMATSQGFVNWICGPALEPAFLRDLFVAENSFLHSISEGVAHTTIYFPKAKAFHICLPPVNEQRRIVAKIEELFSDLDAGVAALERVRANLKRYRAAVLKAAVEGRLTEEWRKQHPATEPAAKLLERILAERRAKWEQDQLRRFKEAGKEPPKGWKERYKSPVGHEETSLPELPASWSWTSLSVVAWQVRDGPHHSPKYSPEGIPFITGGHVRPDGIDFTRAKFISLALHKEFSRRCEPAVGDLLYTKGGTTGIAHIVRDERAFSVWVHVAVLKLADSINRRYLQHMLNSPLCYRQAQKYTHGVGNQDLGLTRMIKIAISLPPLAEQAEIVAEVDRRLSVADAAETQVEHALQRAARLRQAILKRAFEGKLVPQDPTDEPAAALLERVATDGSNKRTPIGPQRRKVALAKDRSTR